MFVSVTLSMFLLCSTATVQRRRPCSGNSERLTCQQKQHRACLYIECSFVLSLSCWEMPQKPTFSTQRSLVAIWRSRAWGHCGLSIPSLSMASPAVAQDAVSAAASFFIIFSLTFRRRLSKLSGLLVNTAAWQATHGVSLHMMPSLTGTLINIRNTSKEKVVSIDFQSYY